MYREEASQPRQDLRGHPVGVEQCGRPLDGPVQVFNRRVEQTEETLGEILGFGVLQVDGWQIRGAGRPRAGRTLCEGECGR